MKVRRNTPICEAIQWDGQNTTEVVNMLQGAWKDDGIWLRQLWREGSEPVWRLVIDEDVREADKGDWIVKSPTGVNVISDEAFSAEYRAVD